MRGADLAAALPFWQQLNEAQRRAVQHVHGPLLVIAGPGSGKTRVLTYRVAYLIATGAAPPDRILAVTFTNKAASEMVRRLTELLGESFAAPVWAGTFHATCVQILRREAAYAGLPRDFAIYDTPDQLQVMRSALKALDVDPRRYDPRAMLGECSRLKNELVTPDEAQERASTAYERLVARVYQAYQKALREAGAVDFDDLLVETVLLLSREPEILARYQRRFQFILVDEYQDTNRVQYLLVRQLAAAHRNVMVVGDDMQSIYGWRGADIRNILSFQQDYPDATVIRLEQNYRSVGTIVEAANHLIQHNTRRLDKRLWTDNPRGGPIVFCQAEDERAEAAFVAHRIQRHVEQGASYRDMAVLYRTHAQSRAFEEAFLARSIPYRIVAGLRFYERKEVKDLLAYLRLVAAPHDLLSLRRIINVPRRGVGEASLARLEEFARARELPVGLAIRPACEEGLFPRPTARALTELADRLDSWREAASREGPTQLLDRVLSESGYLQALEQEGSDEALARIENLKELRTVTRRFEEEHPGAGLDEFLAHVALMSDVDAYDDRTPAVTLMTLHAAKGLEFPVVFLVGLEEGVLPHARSTFESADLEEERRLCYVGVTRAREQLYLTCARLRILYGQVAQNEVSRFVEEIPAELRLDVSRQWLAELARREARLLVGAGLPGAGSGSSGGRGDGGGPAGWATGRRARGGRGAGELSVSTPAVEWKAGDRLRHRSFGEGTVVATEAAGRDVVLTVAFPGAGVRRLLASAAPIEPVRP